MRPRSCRARFVAFLALSAALVAGDDARAQARVPAPAPSERDESATSEGAPAEPASDPSEREASDPSATPSEDGAGTAGSAPSKKPREIEFSPVPNAATNPIDLLPRDILYPPNVEVAPLPVVWRPEWPRFGTADWIVTGAGAAVALASAIIAPQPRHVYGGLLFDEAVRDAIRLRDPQARFNARDVSDVILSLEATWPFFVDAVLTTWWFRGSPDAAAQMALVDAEALALVTGVQGLTNTMVSRERPYGRTCGDPDQPDATVECEGNVRHRSFFSGHAAFSFMSAGLVCTHHLKHRLLRGAGDAIACAVAFTGAAAVGTLRVMGDMHYATDVLTGALVGTVIGVGVPLFHYRNKNVIEERTVGAEGEPRSPHPPSATISIIPIGAGLGVGGVF